MKIIYRALILFSIVMLSWGLGSSYKGIPKHYHALLDSAMVKAGDNASELLKAIEEGKEMTKVTAGEIMIKDPVTVAKNTPAMEIIHLLQDEKLRDDSRPVWGFPL